MEDFHLTTGVNATSVPANSTPAPSTTNSQSQDEDNPLDWMYIMFGVLIWIALIVGCGFAWTQLCKAFYFSSNVCTGCVDRMRRNPGIKWLLDNKFFKFYFGNGSCCSEEEDDDENNNDDDDPVSRRRSGDGQSETGDLGRVNNGCDNSNSNSNTDHAAPPPPYDVALYMRRPPEGELEEGACNLGREPGNLV